MHEPGQIHGNLLRVKVVGSNVVSRTERADAEELAVGVEVVDDLGPRTCAEVGKRACSLE